MKIESLMTRDVLTCRPDDKLVEAARIMWENDCGCVPVVDPAQRVIGMVTDRDVCMAAYMQGQRLEDALVQNVMSRDVRSCRSSDDVRKAESTMRADKLHRLPVVNESGKLVGLLSINDIACEAARESSMANRQVTFEEVGATLAAICEHRRAAAPETGI
jgi:CBS domain-containing protein